MTIRRGFLVAILLTGPAALVRGDDPAPPVPVLSRTAEAGPASTVYSDAERLARAEAEIALLKQTRAAERARPQWWEFGCMGCLSVATVLLILGAIVL